MVLGRKAHGLLGSVEVDHRIHAERRAVAGREKNLAASRIAPRATDKIEDMPSRTERLRRDCLRPGVHFLPGRARHDMLLRPILFRGGLTACECLRHCQAPDLSPVTIRETEANINL